MAYPTLNQNKVLTSLYNMIISQEVFADNVSLKGSLVEKFRIDGTLYGDTKLFISTDINTVRDFPVINETVLTKKQPNEPNTQAVVIDTFKQTAITVDGVKLKQAFASADIYGAFVSVVISWLRVAYKVLNVTLINTFVGTVDTSAVSGEVEVEIPEKPTTGIVELQAFNSYLGELVGQKIGDVVVDLEDALRTYNELGYLRAYNVGDFIIVWNKAVSNLIKHVSLPKIFHKGDVIDTSKMEDFTINDRYFGNVVVGVAAADGLTHRTTKDRIVTVGSDGKYAVNGTEKQFFPADILPKDTPLEDGDVYVEDKTIICKIIHKRAIPFMSAMLVASEFYNPKDLDRTHYLTWGYSKPEYLKEFPIVKLVLVEQDGE